MGNVTFQIKQLGSSILWHSIRLYLVVFTLALIYCFHGTSVEAQAQYFDEERWVYTISSTEFDWYVDQKTIDKLPNKSVQCWVRMESSTDTTLKKERFRLQAKAQFHERIPEDGWQNYTHTIVLWECNIEEKKFRYAIRGYRGKTNGLICYWRTPKSKWNPVHPGTVAEIIFDRITELARAKDK
jgi:hypothetical protein